MVHTGENIYGQNPKTWRKLLKNHDEQTANPVPDPEEFWIRNEDVINDWSGPPAKGEEELLMERIEKNLKGWPWRGAPRKLLMVVCVLPLYDFGGFELTALQSPYAMNYHDEVGKEPVSEFLCRLPTVVQKSKLFTKLFAAKPILDRIAVHLFKYHDSSWKFFATCQEAGQFLAQVLVCPSAHSQYYLLSIN